MMILAIIHRLELAGDRAFSPVFLIWPAQRPTYVARGADEIVMLWDVYWPRAYDTCLLLWIQCNRGPIRISRVS